MRVGFKFNSKGGPGLAHRLTRVSGLQLDVAIHPTKGQFIFLSGSFDLVMDSVEQLSVLKAAISEIHRAHSFNSFHIFVRDDETEGISSLLEYTLKLERECAELRAKVGADNVR